MGDLDFRRFTADDRHETFAMFRESIFDYVKQLGLVDQDAVPDIDGKWDDQKALMLHLEETAAEDWVADDGSIIGWARTVVRDNHAQLTHFFVAPGQQGRGVGSGLLGRAFGPGVGESRSVLATQNPNALSLYLRHGVQVRGSTFEFVGKPAGGTPITDLDIRQVENTPDQLQALTDIDAQLLGYRREVDIRFLLNDRPAYLFSRDGRTVGYAFGSNGVYAGPAGAMEQSDLPAVLQQINASAHELGQETLELIFPAAAHSATQWALSAGYRIDPFYEMLMTDTRDMKLDRMVMTQPSFIW